MICILNTVSLTIVQILGFQANAQKGETVFIHGSSGGVGLGLKTKKINVNQQPANLAACQLASAKGLQVFGTASTERGAQVAKANGAKAVYNHSERGYVKKVHNEHPHGNICFTQELI